MRYLVIVGLFLTVLLIGAGCAKTEAQSPCPKGYILVNDICCSDYDGNGICDSEQMIGEQEEGGVEETAEGGVQPEQPEEQPVGETGYFWDSTKITVVGYKCGNNSISIDLKNTLKSMVTVYKVKLGQEYARGLPETFGFGEVKSIDVRNTQLVEGTPIGLGLFLEYKNWETKQTGYLGPSALEGVCR